MNEEETPKNRFEGEMMRRMELVILKLGGFETRFDNLEKDVSQIKSDVKDVSEIKSDVKVIKGQFNDVAVMAIEDNKRITKLESEVAELQSNIH